MADRIDPETRAMIDRKLAELGDKARVPPGYSPEVPGARSHFSTPRNKRLWRRAEQRRTEIKAAFEADPATRVAALARQHGVTAARIYADLRRIEDADPSFTRTKLPRGRPKSEQKAEAITEITDMIRAGRSRHEILDARPESGLTVTRYIKAALDADPELQIAPSRRTPERVKRMNGRRFAAPRPATGAPNALPADHPAVIEDRTMFPAMIKEAAEVDRVLKSGKHNRKIGAQVQVGRLSGAPIYTLTLPERSTCPPCANRRDCYLNNMPMAQRIAPGADLELALLDECYALQKAHPAGFLVRLHIGGDFYSWDYLRHWARLLRDFPALNVFGFTSWRPDSEIGADIAELREHFSPRFEIRHSNRTGPHGTFQIDHQTRLKRLGDAVVCPEMRDAYMAPEKQSHCGSCGICWTGKPTPIVFILH